MWFQSVEFYVIAASLAAAIIALAARPSSRGAARTWLLHPALSPYVTSDHPSLSIECDDDGDVTVTRTGLPSDLSSITLSITLTGHDVAIEEHIVSSGQSVDSSRLQASVRLDFFGRDRYHLSYEAASQSLFTAMDFTVRPGLRAVKEFTLS